MLSHNYICFENYIGFVVKLMEKLGWWLLLLQRFGEKPTL